MSEPRDPKEPQDPLRSLFREAGEFGQALTAPDTAAGITRRGMRAQRRRMAVVAVGVCLVVGGGGAVSVGLLPVRQQPVAPATSPSPSYPSPVPSEGLPTEPPSPPPSPSTTMPGSTGTEGPSGRTTEPGGPPTPTRTSTSTRTTPPTATATASATASATTDGDAPTP
ncbi:hypothetical protein AB0D92_16360 [Streptomyces parvus]|uniref:hypothetical protein n=1 Tax=Streptomyces parvus TaxID=66428 RepID=UPI0033F923A5